MFAMTEPDPGNAMALLNRKGLHTGRRGRCFLSRRMDASTRGIIGQPMVAADNPISFTPPLGERHELMPTSVLQGRYAAIAQAVKNDAAITYHPLQQVLPHLRTPGGSIPSIQGKTCCRGQSCHHDRALLKVS